VTAGVARLFEDSGAVLRGHFRLTSGRHSPVYWEKAKVLQYPAYTEKLCKMIAGHFRQAKIDLVAGPTTPGIILAYETARQLGVRAIFAEKADGGGREFRRGFVIQPGERVLVVDDVLTTGGSVRAVIAAVRQLGGVVAGVGVLVDRTASKVDFGVPFYACHRADEVSYPPEECPLCAAGVPLTTPGSSQPKTG